MNEDLRLHTSKKHFKVDYEKILTLIYNHIVKVTTDDHFTLLVTPVVQSRKPFQMKNG